MQGALAGRVPDPTPNMGDWNNHLTTLFPDVRLKRFIEMRGADGGPWRDICALPALWVGLLYDGDALAEAEELVRAWSATEVGRLRDAVPRQGFAARIGGRSVREIAAQMLEISAAGLGRRARRNSQ